MMAFYHDVRDHTSPSALALWAANKRKFVAQYFLGEEPVPTPAMEMGRAVAALIEAGAIKPQKIFAKQEEWIEATTRSGFRVVARLDAYDEATAEFVDHKATENPQRWSGVLPTDVKFLATAWVVWAARGRRKKGVVGWLEAIPVDLAAGEVLERAQSLVERHHYAAETLAAFEDKIEEWCREINSEYERWEFKSGGTDDLAALADELADLERRKKAMEDAANALRRRILEQMEQRGIRMVASESASVSLAERKRWNHPADLVVRVGRKKFTLAQVEEIEAAKKKTLKEWEATHAPESVQRTLQVRLRN